MESVGYLCNGCREVFHYSDEVTLLNVDGDVVIDENTEDVTEILCGTCLEDRESKTT